MGRFGRFNDIVGGVGFVAGRSILSLESFDALQWLSGLAREQITHYQRDLESKRGLDHYIATTLNSITESVSIKD